MSDSSFKGWLGLCPVILTVLDEESCFATYRHWSLAIWFYINVFIFSYLFGARVIVTGGYSE